MPVRSFYAKRSRVVLTAIAIAFFLFTTLYTAALLTEGQDVGLLLQVLFGVIAVAVGLAVLRLRRRPVVEVSDDSVRLTALAAFRPRELRFEELAAVEPETGALGRLSETLRLHLSSGEVVRLVLAELDQGDRVALRALLEDAVRL